MALDGNNREDLLAAYRTLLQIRAFETTTEDLFLNGRIPGFVHTYIGEEAIAVGVCSALRLDDYIVSTHRGHGHAIAKGVELNGLMAELYGKVTGVCRGRGGSMHVADFSKGVLGANGIVAAGTVIATGAAMSIRHRNSDQVAVCFFGDGGINKGTLHESMNFCATKKLPVIFVCENNQYAQFTSRTRTTSVDDLSQRAIGYGIPGTGINGNDLPAVASTADEAVTRARGGGGPSLIVADTYRIGGHYVGDAQVYRTRSEVEEQLQRDPILHFEAELRAAGFADDALVDAERTAAQALVDDAVAFAETSEFPDPDDAMRYVFTEAEGEAQ